VISQTREDVVDSFMGVHSHASILRIGFRGGRAKHPAQHLRK
jgi:hypothetical protein